MHPFFLVLALTGLIPSGSGKLRNDNIAPSEMTLKELFSSSSLISRCSLKKKLLYNFKHTPKYKNHKI